jgi:hypothetical protein
VHLLDDEEENMELRKKLEEAINLVSAENGSNTPDFVLAEYLTDCLAAFDKAAKRREGWYGVKMFPGWNADSSKTVTSIVKGELPYKHRNENSESTISGRRRSCGLARPIGSTLLASGIRRPTDVPRMRAQTNLHGQLRQVGLCGVLWNCGMLTLRTMDGKT